MKRGAVANSRPRFAASVLLSIATTTAFVALMVSRVFAQTAPQPNPERNAYFGELHIHSDWSMDAYVFGTRIGPEDEIKYAMGEPVIHPGGLSGAT